MTKNIIIVIGIFLTGIVGGIFAEQLLWPYFVERPLFLEYGLEQRPIYITEEKEFYIEENTALREAIKKVDSVVVEVRANGSEQIISGTGIIITSDGLVLTVSENVPENSEVTLISQRGNLTAEVIKRKNGFVLLKTQGDGWPTVGFANENNIELGQRVFFLGTFLENLDLRNFVDEGILSYVSEKEIKTNILDEEISTGSPLFDIKGNLVGIKSVDQEGSFIIPISKISEFSGF